MKTLYPLIFITLIIFTPHALADAESAREACVFTVKETCRELLMGTGETDMTHMFSMLEKCDSNFAARVCDKAAEIESILKPEEPKVVESKYGIDVCIAAYEPYAGRVQAQKTCECIHEGSEGLTSSQTEDLYRIETEFVPFTMKRILSGGQVREHERTDFAQTLNNPMILGIYSAQLLLCP